MPLEDSNLNPYNFNCNGGSPCGVYSWNYPQISTIPVSIAANSDSKVFYHTGERALYIWDSSLGVFVSTKGLDAKMRGTFADLTDLNTSITTAIQGDTAILVDGGTISGGVSGKSALVYYDGSAWVFQSDFEYVEVISRDWGKHATITALNTVAPTPSLGDSAYVDNTNTISGGQSGVGGSVFYDGTNWVVTNLTVYAEFVQDSTSLPTTAELAINGDTATQQVSEANGTVKRFFARVAGTVNSVGGLWNDATSEWQMGDWRVLKSNGNIGKNTAPVSSVDVYINKKPSNGFGLFVNGTGGEIIRGSGDSASIVGRYTNSGNGFAVWAENSGGTATPFTARKISAASGIVDILELRENQVASANGDGLRLSMVGLDNANNGRTITSLRSAITDNSSTAMDTQAVIAVMTNNAVADILTMHGDFSGANDRRVVVNGDLQHTGSLIPSDKNLKENIEQVATHEFEYKGKRFKLSFYQYDWKDLPQIGLTKSRKQFGYIAQEVEEAFYSIGFNPFDEGILSHSYIQWVHKGREEEIALYNEYEPKPFGAEDKIEELQNLKLKKEHLEDVLISLQEIPKEEGVSERIYAVMNAIDSIGDLSQLDKLLQKRENHYKESYAEFTKARENEATLTPYLAIAVDLKNFKI